MRSKTQPGQNSQAQAGRRGAAGRGGGGAHRLNLAPQPLGVDSANAVYVGHDPEIDLAGASAAGLLPLALPEAEGLRALPARIARIANLGA